PIFIVTFFKRFQARVHRIKVKDNKWGTLLITAMFMGLISSFLGSALAGGLVSILTLLSAALLMLICLQLEQKAGLTRLKDFALPVSMIGGMALAVFYSGILGR